MMIRTIVIWLGLAASIGTAAQTTNTFPASGSVGIGTTNPNSLLEVNGGAQVDGTLQVGNGTGAANLLLQDISGANWTIGTGNYLLNFTDSTGSKLLTLCDSSSSCNGRLGVGTTNPIAEVDIELNTDPAGGGPAQGLRAVNNVNTVSAGDNPQNHLATEFSGSGTQSTLYGVDSVVMLSSSGTITDAYADMFSIYNTNSTGVITNGFGAYAQSPSGGGTITNAYAFYANAQSVSGVSHAYGFYQAGASDTNYFAGKVGIGTSSPGAQLEVKGNLKLTANSGGSITFQDGTVQTTAYPGASCGGDFAESVNVMGNRRGYEPGDLLVIDPKAPGKFLEAAKPYSTLVAGIYSTKPGVVGRRLTGPKDPDEVPMAMVGIVPTKVTAENGPIHTGDLLVASSSPGRAMRGSDRKRMTGAVVGKALGDLESGTGVIEVLVTLQ